tara:strand:- start:125 stop:379 length:255 start_codon:yes stop_codon:yes gene_type:complete
MAEKSSLWDKVVDNSLVTMRLVRGELEERFKHTKPFRMERVTREEKLLEYDELTPSQEAINRQHFGDDAMNTYIDKMERLKGGR